MNHATVVIKPAELLLLMKSINFMALKMSHKKEQSLGRISLEINIQAHISISFQQPQRDVIKLLLMFKIIIKF